MSKKLAFPKTSLFWEITHPKLKKTSYLMGTIHLRSEEVFLYAEQMKSFISKVQTVAVEIDLSQGLPSVASADMPTLEFTLGKEATRKLLSDLHNCSGYRLDMFAQLPPLFVAGALPDLMMEKPCPMILDEFLVQCGKKLGRKTLGLESLASQQSVAEALPNEIFIKAIRKAMKQWVRSKVDLVHQVCMYRAGNIKALYAATSKDLDGHKTILNDDRNKTMTKKLIQVILEDQSVFAGVGTAHLPGKKGMIQLLKKEGFSVRPLPMEPNVAPLAQILDL